MKAEEIPDELLDLLIKKKKIEQARELLEFNMEEEIKKAITSKEELKELVPIVDLLSKKTPLVESKKRETKKEKLARQRYIRRKEESEAEKFIRGLTSAYRYDKEAIKIEKRQREVEKKLSELESKIEKSYKKALKSHNISESRLSKTKKTPLEKLKKIRAKRG